MNAKVPMILAGNFKPGFRIELHIKDLMNALDTAHELNVPIPLSGQVLEMMQALKADGKALLDHSGLVQFYEGMAKVQVRRQVTSAVTVSAGPRKAFQARPNESVSPP
jgi:2-hydroxy-3-oxopropionate reductase